MDAKEREIFNRIQHQLGTSIEKEFDVDKYNVDKKIDLILMTQMNFV